MKKILLGLLLATLASTGWGQAKFSYFGPVNGILKGSTTTWVTTNAANTDVVGLWTGTCSNTTYLRGDGTCATPPGTGGGTVNSVSQTVPAGFSVSGSPVTNTGTLAISYATGQTANNFLATPNGIAGALALRTIVAADLPLISLSTGVTSILPVPNGGIGVSTLTGLVKGNGTSAFSAAASADVYGLWSGTCSSTTFLRGDGACATPTAGGTVTSVDMTVPSGFTITGSPVTTSGTLAIGGTLNVSAGGSGAATLSGVLKGNGTAAIGSAAAADVYGLWSGTCSSATFLRGDGACAAPSGTSFANPSGLIGMTATNGVATTAERSDATHAIDPAIAPTWTGLHTFAAAAPTQGILLKDTGAALNAKIANLVSTGGFFSITGVTDAGVNGTNLFVGTRNGSGWSAVTIGNTTDKPAITLNGPVIIPAPASGATVSMTAASASTTALIITGSSAGQALIEFAANAGANFGFVGTAGAAAQVVADSVLGDTVVRSATGIRLTANGGASTNVLVGSAGNVTIAAPSSGGALTINGAAGVGVYTSRVNGSTTASQSFGQLILAGTNATDASLVVNNAANTATFFDIAGNGQFTLGYNGSTADISASAAGNITIAAPSSSHTLSLTAAGGSEALVIVSPNTASNSFGAIIEAGTNSSDYGLRIINAAANTTFFTVNGDGGVQAGAPTGGDKGVGSINMQSCYVNNQPCLTTTSGGATKFASGVLTTAASSCTINFNGGGIASCTYNSAGNVTVNFTASYFGTGATCVPAGNNGVNLLVTGPGTPITSSANITLRTSAGTFTDGIFSLVCAGT